METTLKIIEKETLGLPPLSKKTKKVSEEEYWRDFYEHPDYQYEWKNGYLEEKPMPDFLSVEVYTWFIELLKEYLRTSRIGRVMTLEMGFRLDLGDEVSVRKPDLGVILHSNPVQAHPSDRSFHGICDMCIELLSDSSLSEVERDTVIKKREYAKAGVKEYYILDRYGKHTAFYRLNQSGFYEPLEESEKGVICSAVLEGFAFRIEHLSIQPLFKDLIHDPIYQPFIRKDLQEERQQKEEALKRESLERQQKEEERQQKEEALKREARLLEILKKAGIDPNA